MDVETRCELERYLALVRDRANGTLQTAATFIREFITSHPAYKRDSVITPGINYDLMKHLDAIEQGQVVAPQFLPSWYAQRRREAHTRDQQAAAQAAAYVAANGLA